MPSAQAQFKEEVTQAHRTALQALHDILADTVAPVETDDDHDDTEPTLTEPERLSLRLRAAAAILRVKAGDDEEDELEGRDGDVPASPAPLRERMSRGATGEGSSPPTPVTAGRVDGAPHQEPEVNQSDCKSASLSGGGPATPGEGSSLAPRASRLKPKRKRPLTPAEIKAAKAKATFDHIARTNEAAYQDLLILRAKAQQQREAAAAARAAAGAASAASTSTPPTDINPPVPTAPAATQPNPSEPIDIHPIAQALSGAQRGEAGPAVT